MAKKGRIGSMWLAYNIEGKGNELTTQMQGACSLAVAAESSIVTNVNAAVVLLTAGGTKYKKSSK